MSKALTMLQVDNLKDKNETSSDLRPLSRQECRNLIATIESQHEKLEILQEQKEIYKKYWLDLCDKIIAEINKDGWCRLTITKEQALEMKKMFESYD